MKQTTLSEQLKQILEAKKEEKLRNMDVPKIEETAKHVPEPEAEPVNEEPVQEAPKPRRRRRKILDDDED